MQTALQRILENIRTQEEYLDLTHCDLNYEVPDELIKCYWLKGIAFGIPDNGKNPEWMKPKEFRANKNKLSGHELMKLVLPNLQELYCCDVGLETTEWLHSGVIKKLYLDNNKLKTLRNLYGTIHLEDVSAKNNQIEGVGFLCQNKKIKEVNLPGNNIKVLADFFADLVNLEYLNLSSNKIPDVKNLKGLLNLKHLLLADNLITDIHPLGNLSKLQTLALPRNRITTIKPLAGLNELKTLTVQENRIAQIDYELLQMFERLDYLGIVNNPILNYSNEKLRRIEQKISERTRKRNEESNVGGTLFYLGMVLFGLIVGGIASEGHIVGFIIGGLLGPTMCMIIIFSIKNPHPKYRK